MYTIDLVGCINCGKGYKEFEIEEGVLVTEVQCPTCKCQGTLERIR